MDELTYQIVSLMIKTCNFCGLVMFWGEKCLCFFMIYLIFKVFTSNHKYAN